MCLIDNNGTIVVQYWYDAWGNHKVVDANGNEITSSNHLGNLNPFRYRGYYYDAETGLYFLQTRYYDPDTGRFLNRDSVNYADPQTINGLNLYAYCLNNPVAYVDPSGQIVLTLLIMGVVGASVSAVSSIVTQVIQNNGEINWAIVGLEALAGGISGLLSVAPVGFIGQGLINGALSMTTYFVGSAIEGSDISSLGALSSFGFGFITGLLGGDGLLKEFSFRNLTQMEHTLIKNIFSGKGFINSVIKQSKTYLGKIYTSAVKESIQTGLMSTGTTLLIGFSEILL